MTRHGMTLVYCPVKKKMVEKGTQQKIDQTTGAPMIIPPLEPFISPITGEEITSREQLRRHNRDHGVTNAQDYSAEWMERKTAERERKARGDTPQDRAERIELLKQAVYGSR